MRAPALLLTALALAACQSVETARAPEAPPATPAAAAPAPRAASPASEDLAAYLARLRAMNEASLAAEAARQKQSAARTPDDLGRLKAALALALVPQSEENDIVSLVDPIVRKPGLPADVRLMASFLQASAQDRRRLKESAAAARTTLRDERRAFEAQKQRADAMQEKAAQLQQKLDALTELEKSLSDRSPPSR
jgi:hypothetical protein